MIRGSAGFQTHPNEIHEKVVQRAEAAVRLQCRIKKVDLRASKAFFPLWKSGKACTNPDEVHEEVVLRAEAAVRLQRGIRRRRQQLGLESRNVQNAPTDS